MKISLPRSVAILGTILDLVYREDGEKIQKTSFPGYFLCSDNGMRRLWIWPTVKAKKSDKTPEQLRRASKVRAMWSEFQPDEVLETKPPLGKNILLLGPVEKIGYRSDKWKADRRTEDYQHDYETRPKLYRSGRVFWIQGGDQRITARGIVG